MADDLPLQLLGGAELEGQLKEGQPGKKRDQERRVEESRGVKLSRMEWCGEESRRRGEERRDT